MSITSGIISKYATAVGAISEASNGYQYVDGTLIGSVISKSVITASLAKTWVVPGIACSEEFMEGIDVNKVWSVTVELQSNIGPTTRTFGPSGTTNNNGLINYAPAIVGTTVPIEIKLNQIDDQQVFFPRLQLETMRYDKFEKTMENFIDNMVISKATFETAAMLAYALFRASPKYTLASNTAGALPDEQFIEIDTSKIYDENYMIKIINSMDEKMSAGDMEMNAMTFSGPRACISRLSLINAFKSPKTGFVSVAGSSEAYKLLMSASFDTGKTADVCGGTTEQYRGEMRGYDFYEIPGNAFTYVEKWLGLSAGSLSGVLGIITSPQQFASGGLAEANTMVMEQVSPYPGVYASPYRKFGAKGVRNIILLVDSTFKTAVAKTEFNKLIGVKASGTALTAPAEIVAPAEFSTKTVVENTLSNGPKIAYTK